MPFPSPQPGSSSGHVESALAVSPSLPAGSQDSEKTISTAVAVEVRTLAEQTFVDQVESVWVEESMTVAKYPVVTAVGDSATLDTTLVLALTSSPSPSLAGQFVDDQHLANEVVQSLMLPIVCPTCPPHGQT
jgi:hypothetical protein